VGREAWSAWPVALTMCWSWGPAAGARWAAGLFPGEPLLPGPRPLSRPRHPSACPGRRARAWPPGMGVPAPVT